MILFFGGFNHYLMENASSAPRALVKEANIVKFSWKLCSQPLKDEKKYFLCRIISFWYP
jgi:hypothetical protein